MKIVHVEGKDKGKVMIYALSTCIWCRKTKQLFKDQGIAFDYCDVDLEQGKDREEAKSNILKWNPSISFPTVVINNKDAVLGYEPDEIKEKLGL